MFNSLQRGVVEGLRVQIWLMQWLAFASGWASQRFILSRLVPTHRLQGDGVLGCPRREIRIRNLESGASDCRRLLRATMRRCSRNRKKSNDLYPFRVWLLRNEALQDRMNKHINPSMYHFHVKMGNHLKKLDIFEIKVHTFQIESNFLQLNQRLPTLVGTIFCWRKI